MAAIGPDSTQAYGPGPHEINNHLIESVHHAIRLHPAAAAKATYGKILASLLAQQATAHAAEQTAGQQGVQGAQSSGGDNGTGMQAGQVIQTLTGGPGGGPSYVGDPTPNPLVAAIVQAMHATNAGALPQAGGNPGVLHGLIHPAVVAQHVPLSQWAA